MVDLNDSVWRGLDSAGGNAAEALRRVLEGGGAFRENMAILGENLSHQLTWYSATACVLPHLAALCPRLSPADRMFLIAQMGPAAAAEAEWPLSPGTDVYREFYEGINGLRPVVKDLIQNHMDVLTAASEADRAMFALGALAFLGNRRRAYALWHLSGYCWEEGPAACSCGWECELFDLTADSEYLEAADIAPWDGKSLKDEAVWLNGLLSRLGVEEIPLPRLYGTAACPECGKREPYWTMFDCYWKAE